MSQISESTMFKSLMGLLMASFLIALVGMCIHIAWLGQPAGREAGWVGDISAGVYTAAMILTFGLAAARQDPHAHKTGKRAHNIH